MGVSVFPQVPGDRTKGNGLKLQPGRFCFRKNFFSERVEVLEEADQGGGGVTFPGSVQETTEHGS